MKRNLLVGVALLVVGYGVGQLMSQPRFVNTAGANQPRTFNPPNMGQNRRPITFNEKVKIFKDELSGEMNNLRDSHTSARGTELMTALDNFIAADELGGIISELQTFLVQSAGTGEAKKAAAAVEILNSATPTATTVESVVQPAIEQPPSESPPIPMPAPAINPDEDSND